MTCLVNLTTHCACCRSWGTLVTLPSGLLQEAHSLRQQLAAREEAAAALQGAKAAAEAAAEQLHAQLAAAEAQVAAAVEQAAAAQEAAELAQAESQQAEAYRAGLQEVRLAGCPSGSLCGSPLARPQTLLIGRFTHHLE